MNFLGSPVLPNQTGDPFTSMKPSKMIEDEMFKPGPVCDTENTQCQELFAFAMKYKLSISEFSNFHKCDLRRNTTSYMSKVKINEWTFPSTLFKDYGRVLV